MANPNDLQGTARGRHRCILCNWIELRKPDTQAALLTLLLPALLLLTLQATQPRMRLGTGLVCGTPLRAAAAGLETVWPTQVGVCLVFGC